MSFFDKSGRQFDGGGWFDREIEQPLDAPVTPPTLSVPGAYARMLTALLPPGKVWRLVGGDSILAKVLLACSDELDRLDARALDLLEEADPSTAVELLPEYESELGLDEAATTAERQARIVARTIARQRFRSVDFQNALAPLLGQDPGAVVVMERSHAYAMTIGKVPITGDEIFRFFIYRNPALPGTYYLASAQALVDEIKPSHTAGYVIESVSFLCNDPHSLCNRDLLGL